MKHYTLFVLLLTLLYANTETKATVYTFHSTISNNYEDAENWLPSPPPASLVNGDSIIIDSVSCYINSSVSITGFGTVVNNGTLKISPLTGELIIGETSFCSVIFENHNKIINYGQLNNNAEIRNTGIIDNIGTFTNSKILLNLLNEADLQVEFNNRGDLINNQSIYIQIESFIPVNFTDSIQFVNNNYLENNGSIDLSNNSNSSGGGIEFDNTGYLLNKGTVNITQSTNNGIRTIFRNEGLLRNDEYSTFNFFETIDLVNEGTIANKGYMDIWFISQSEKGIIKNTTPGLINMLVNNESEGHIYNLGGFINMGASSFLGTITNVGEMEDSFNSIGLGEYIDPLFGIKQGVLNNEYGGIILDNIISGTNSGIINNEGSMDIKSISNEGELHNKAFGLCRFTISNSNNNNIIQNEENGVMEILNYFENQATGIITNKGTLTLSSTMKNEGSLLNNNRTIFNSTYEGDFTSLSSDFSKPSIELGLMSETAQISINTSSSLAGNYIQDDSTSLLIDIASDIDYDQLNVVGAATLEGKLNVTFLGGYAPFGMQEYTIMTYASFTGAFTTTNLPDIAPATWELIYNPTELILRINPPAPDNAIDFDGVDDFVIIYGNAGSIGTLQTIEFKFAPQKTDASQQGDRIFTPDEAEFDGILTMDQTTEITGETLMIRNGDDILTIDYPFTSDVHHVAFVSEDGLRYNKVYVNGSETTVHTGMTGVFPAVFDPSYLEISGNENLGTGYYEGILDELRFWNTPRTATEISDNYDTLLEGTETGLIGYFPMNEGLAGGDNSTINELINHSPNDLGSYINAFAQMGDNSNWVEICTFSPQTNTFFGSGDWFDANNWSLNTVPRACHDVYILASKPVLIPSGSSAICNTIQVDFPANFTIEQGAIFDAIAK